MKFSQLEYKPFDFDKFFLKATKLIEKFEKAKTAQQQYQAYVEIDSLSQDYFTSNSLSRVRYFIDTSDEFYKNEVAAFAKNSPIYVEKFNRLYKLMIENPYKEYLFEQIGEIQLLNIQLFLKTTSPDIVEDMQEENRLVNEYNGIVSNLYAELDGEKITLALLAKHKQDPDRNIREKAFLAESQCFLEVKDKLDDIFDRLVKNRTSQAKKLGFRDYTELGYARRRRNCYDVSHVSSFKQQVEQHVVPIVKDIYKTRCDRLGISNITICDTMLAFKEGSPKPQISGDEIVKASLKIYSELSDKTDEFIKFMHQNELFDLYPRKGKYPGGFCSYFINYNYPFIFSNFNGTGTDVHVFTHEIGHALARYVARQNNKHHVEPTADMSEICSITMEYLTAPWYHLFFEEQAARYKIAHIEDGILLIAYACLVDEFQQQVYLNPNMTPKQRDEKWLELEKRFRPDIDMADIPFYSCGSGWQRQTHIFKTPFYYIEYALAQVVAFEFFTKSLQNIDDAVNLYMRMLECISSKTFLSLLSVLEFDSPFEEGVTGSIVSRIKQWLDSQQATN